MKSTDYFELINKKIDGLLTPEEETELDHVIENNPRVETSYQKLLRTTQLLGEMPVVEPPQDLKFQIF